MKIEVAKQFVVNLQAAINQAEAEGRNELSTTDLTVFATADDAARADLQTAIEAASSSSGD